MIDIKLLEYIKNIDDHYEEYYPQIRELMQYKPIEHSEPDPGYYRISSLDELNGVDKERITRLYLKYDYIGALPVLSDYGNLIGFSCHFSNLVSLNWVESQEWSNIQEIHLTIDRLPENDFCINAPKCKKLNLSFDMENQPLPIESLFYHPTLDFSCCTLLEDLTLRGATGMTVKGLDLLSFLRKLVLRYSNLENFEPIYALNHLEVLSIESCGLIEIPNITGLPCLKYLDLSTNSISGSVHLPDSSSLRQLILSHNDIAFFDMPSCPENIQRINLFGNPLENGKDLTSRFPDTVIWDWESRYRNSVLHTFQYDCSQINHSTYHESSSKYGKLLSQYKSKNLSHDETAIALKAQSVFERHYLDANLVKTIECSTSVQCKDIFLQKVLEKYPFFVETHAMEAQRKREADSVQSAFIPKPGTIVHVNNGCNIVRASAKKGSGKITLNAPGSWRSYDDKKLQLRILNKAMESMLQFNTCKYYDYTIDIECLYTISTYDGIALASLIAIYCLNHGITVPVDTAFCGELSKKATLKHETLTKRTELILQENSIHRIFVPRMKTTVPTDINISLALYNDLSDLLEILSNS